MERCRVLTVVGKFTKEREMNKAQMIDLLEDGAYYSRKEEKFFHPSFRKGWRKIKMTNISWYAVEKEHGNWGTKRLVNDDSSVYRLMPK
jgi:hypothetical protein